jgi:uncharacterized membrane protein
MKTKRQRKGWIDSTLIEATVWLSAESKTLGKLVSYNWVIPQLAIPKVEIRRDGNTIFRF